jgi:Mg/Co/Ni transporter MgtE
MYLTDFSLFVPLSPPSSTLTTRAISHGQVRVENYRAWLLKEIGAAGYLGKLSTLWLEKIIVSSIDFFLI